jgi:hypothetical protein
MIDREHLQKATELWHIGLDFSRKAEKKVGSNPDTLAIMESAASIIDALNDALAESDVRLEHKCDDCLPKYGAYQERAERAEQERDEALKNLVLVSDRQDAIRADRAEVLVWSLEEGKRRLRRMLRLAWHRTFWADPEQQPTFAKWCDDLDSAANDGAEDTDDWNQTDWLAWEDRIDKEPDDGD